MRGRKAGGASAPGAAAARYIMIGGFLGAGKTTAVAQLASHLSDRGLRVGLITNDQGSQLVDTSLLQSRGFPVEEISGGCFCCRFNSLMDAARKLSAETRPEVFIAEPVGSCTDLVATVTYPLRRIYGPAFVIAPLSVLVDPIRALRMFGLMAGDRFSEKVRYIYRKQLEEADLILINKMDLLSPEQAARLRRRLKREFPQAEVLSISARHGAGLADWFSRIREQRQGRRRSMPIDYDRYAEGEALLGWLNATIELSHSSPFDGNELLRRLAATLQRRLTTQGAQVAHLKMTLDPAAAIGDLGVINLVRNDYVPELSQQLQDPLSAGQLIINLRAEADPELLRQVVVDSVSSLASRAQPCQARLDHLEYFKPGRPQPTHRDQ